MSSTTPNIGLVLPVGSERVSRQIINENNTKIDTAIGALNSNKQNKMESNSANLRSNVNVVSSEFYLAAANATGAPPVNTAAAWLIASFKIVDGFGIQFASAYNENAKYMRHCWGNEWNPWRKIDAIKHSGNVSTDYITLLEGSYLVKCNGFVFFQLDFKPKQNIAAWTEITKIPEGFRPVVTAFGWLGYGNSFVQVGTNGALMSQASLNSGTNYRICAMTWQCL